MSLVTNGGPTATKARILKDEESAKTREQGHWKECCQIESRQWQ